MTTQQTIGQVIDQKLNDHPFGEYANPKTIEQLLNQAYYWAMSEMLPSLPEYVKNPPVLMDDYIVDVLVNHFMVRCFELNTCQGYYPDMVRKIVKAGKFHPQYMKESLDQFSE
jgi:hypothetical protein